MTKLFFMKNTTYLKDDLLKDIRTILISHIIDYQRFDIDTICQDIAAKSEKDLKAYADLDPASKRSKKLVLQSYKCFKAVLLYRVAHHILQMDDSDQHRIIAREISEYAKVYSGVEIHPAAKIGVPFVIDHGYGTVIGETASIGNHCYFLNNITLGARSIANNSSAKRHPTIGHNVQIGASVSIYGDVTIGDNCFIAPYTMITHDVKEGTKVSCNFRFQEMHFTTSNAKVLGVFPEMEDEKIILRGKNLALNSAECFIETGEGVEEALTILKNTKEKLVLNFKERYTQLKNIIVTIKQQGNPIFSLMISPNLFL